MTIENYKLVSDIRGETAGIQRLSDGALIPISQGNVDYRAYVAWIDAGNTADPADAPPAPDMTPDLSTQLAALLIAKGTIAASDLHPDTLADVNAQLADAGQAQIAEVKDV